MCAVRILCYLGVYRGLCLCGKCSAGITYEKLALTLGLARIVNDDGSGKLAAYHDLCNVISYSLCIIGACGIDYIKSALYAKDGRRTVSYGRNTGLLTGRSCRSIIATAKNTAESGTGGEKHTHHKS